MSLLDFLIPGYDSYKESSKNNPALRGYASDSFWSALGLGKDKQQLENSRRAARLYPIVKPTDSEYLIPYYQENVPNYKGKSYDYREGESFEDVIPFLIDMMESKTPRRVGKKEVLGESIEDKNTGFVAPKNPIVALPEYWTTPMKGSKKYTDREDVHMWTPAPWVEDAPQKAKDFYANYNYKGRGQFENPLSPEYIQALWNEINQQAPNESPNNKVALLETILSMTHGESHGGYDAGGIEGRNTNVFNQGYNAKPTSTMKYDPESIYEMSDYEINQAINTFKMLENQGLTDQQIFNYVVGPNSKAPFQQTVDNYRDLMGGWESLYHPTYPWE